MKFDYVVGNPPYQDGNSNNRLYPAFYVGLRKIVECLLLIFPSAWREPKNSNGLSKMNNEDVKRDKQIVFIKDCHNVFKGISGAEWTNMIMWKKNYDNGLNGEQKIIDEDGNVKNELLLINQEDVEKPKEIESIVEKVNALKENKINEIVSSRKPYDLESEVLNKPEKYNIEINNEYFEGSVRLYGKKDGEGRTFKYIERNKLPKVSHMLDKYKLFVVKAWGNMDEKRGFLGGSYSDIIVAEPLDCCSEMYIEVGPFNKKKYAENARKYFYTKFFRAVFYKNKMSQNTAKETYKSVPIQDFTEKSDIDWGRSVKDINKQLCEKYKLSKREIDFIENNIKEMNV